MTERSGLLSFGSFITDHNMAIEFYPPEDKTTLIKSRRLAAGGPGYNIAANLRRLDPSMRVECQGLLGDDENGQVVLDALERHGISQDGMILTRKAPQIYVLVMASRMNGHRTFFCFRGSADLLDESHCDPSLSRGRIFHVGAPRPSPAPRRVRWTRRQRVDEGPRPGARARLPHEHGDGLLGPRGPATDRAPLPPSPRQYRHQRPRGRGDQRGRDPPGWSARLGGGRTSMPDASGDGGPAGGGHPLPRGRSRRRCRGRAPRTGIRPVARFAHRERGGGGGRVRGRPRLRPARRLAGRAGPRAGGLRRGGMPGRASTPTPPSARGRRARRKARPTATARAHPDRFRIRATASRRLYPGCNPAFAWVGSMPRRGSPAHGGSGRISMTSRHSKGRTATRNTPMKMSQLSTGLASPPRSVSRRRRPRATPSTGTPTEPSPSSSARSTTTP